MTSIASVASAVARRAEHARWGATRGSVRLGCVSAGWADRCMRHADDTLGAAGEARGVRPFRSLRSTSWTCAASSAAASGGGRVHRRASRKGGLALRRGMFKHRDDRPPWETRLEAPVWEMMMEEHDALNPECAPWRRERGREGDEAEEEAAAGVTGVTVRAGVSPVGGGFFVEGDVDAVIAVECECCGCAFNQRVRAPLKAWLDEASTEEDSSGEWEVLPFPRQQEACDLTGLVRDLIRMSVPYERLCDECEDGGESAEGGFVFALEDDE